MQEFIGKLEMQGGHISCLYCQTQMSPGKMTFDSATGPILLFSSFLDNIYHQSSYIIFQILAF